MKALHLRYLATSLLVFFVGICYTFAQSMIPDNPLTGTKDEIAANLVQWYNFAMLAAGYITTYFSRYIPFLKRMDSLAWRAAIITAVWGFVFWKLGAGGLGIAISFLTLINPYEMVLKPLLGGTNPQTPTQEAKDADGLSDDETTDEI